MRTILFAQVNDRKEDILSLLMRTEGQLALSDEQMQEINTHLLVRSTEEFVQKFLPETLQAVCGCVSMEGAAQKVLPGQEEYAGGRRHMGAVTDKLSRDAVDALAHHLVQHAKNRYEIWHPRKSEKACDEMSETVCDRERRKQQEVLLGVKGFFEQAGTGQKNRQSELLILNISVKELLAHPEKCAVFETYLDTVNHKTYTAERVAYAVLPEVSYHPAKPNIRERFQGNGKTGEHSEPIPMADVERLLTVLGRYDIFLLYQYETGADTSAKAFAANGVLPYQRAAAALDKHAYAAHISYCYPNLTAPQEGLYIGAAYVASAMLSASAGEGSVTAFPKELYPYSGQTKEDIAGEKYGCLFVSETPAAGWAAEPHMVMLSSRTCGCGQGTYTIIKTHDHRRWD